MSQTKGMGTEEFLHLYYNNFHRQWKTNVANLSVYETFLILCLKYSVAGKVKTGEGVKLEGMRKLVGLRHRLKLKYIIM